MFKRHIIIIFSFLANNLLFAQESNKFNLESLRNRNPIISAELDENTPGLYKSHPEYGVLPYNAPCQDCFELLQKRTDSTRLYLSNNKGGTEFYSQAVMGVFHYDKNGYKVSYDPTIKMTTPGYFLADNQDKPAFLDLLNKRTGFKVGTQDFVFNNNVELILVNNDNTEISLGVANYSNYTVGDQGARIINAWPNIDIELIYQLDKIKSNFVIKADFADLTDVKRIKFSDNLILPNGYTLINGLEGVLDSDNNWIGDYSVRDENNVEIFNIAQAYGYDQSGLRNRISNFKYQLDGNKLNLLISKEWLSDSERVYPLIIDPTVNSTATFTAGFMVFAYGTGAYCNWSSFCGYNLIVPRPANSTITGTTFSAQYNTINGACGCLMSEAAFKINSICGNSPSPAATYWTCIAPNPGTCSGSNTNIFTENGSCLGSACSGNVTFQMRNSYCFCNYGGGCPVGCHSMPNNSWSVTLIGRTLETLGNSATGNGSQNIIAATCSGNTTLNPTPANGVPGYTYLWNTGAVTPTVNVPSAGGPYSCQVTDACGVARTATFTIACPLAVTYEYFAVEADDRSGILKWKTSFEKDNSHFRVEYSDNGVNFMPLAQVESKGNIGSIYQYEDKDVPTDLRYYRIANVDNDGIEEFTDIQVLNFNNKDSDLKIVPNPNSGEFNISFQVPTEAQYSLIVTNSLGEVILNQNRILPKGSVSIPIDMPELAKGVYVISLIGGNRKLQTKLVVE